MNLPYNPSVSRYYQVSRLIQMRIEAGSISNSDRLPSEEMLCREFGVSRTTIRQALGLLKNHGLLNGRRGAGTFVSAKTAPGHVVRTLGDPIHHGLGTKVRVVSIETIPAPARVANFLRLPFESPALRVIRVHRVAGAPLSAVVTYLPPDLAAVVRRADLRRTTLQEILWQKRGLAIARSVRTIRVQRADETIAPLLGVSLMDPVLHIQSESYLASGEPIRLADNYFREDQYQYTTEIQYKEPESARPAFRREERG